MTKDKPSNPEDTTPVPPSEEVKQAQTLDMKELLRHLQSVPNYKQRYSLDIQAAEARIASRLIEIVDKLIELGEGVHVEKEYASGRTKVYKIPPDIKALIYLCDRVMGTAIRKIETEGTLSLDVKNTVKDMSDDDLRKLVEG